MRSDCATGTVGLLNDHWLYYYNDAPIIDECIECQYQVFGCADCGIDWTSSDYYVCNSCNPGMSIYDVDYNDWC